MAFSEELKRYLGVWLPTNAITELEKNAVPLTGIHTSSVEENVAGLSSAITLANAIKATMNTHAANGVIHYHGGSATPDIANYPVATADATNLTTLKALVGAMLTAYAAHNVDAIAATPTYHVAQDTTHALTSAVTPTTLAQSITRLNDLKTKYNLHAAETTAHISAGVAEATSDAANGTAIKFAVASATNGDSAQVTILNGGAGSTLGSATEPDVDDGYLTVTFSKDPASDTVFSYEIFRNA